MTDRYRVDRVFLARDAARSHSQEPSPMHTYDVTVTTSASPETVWKLLVDAASWPLWSKVDSLDTTRSTSTSTSTPAATTASVPSGLSGRDAS
ncbi:hypothetical protein [Streptomyces coffeae]|uniref:hypothetical protein n=1 Tax=Streptomyces coffeae TaxID=621382 RepID=UPI001F2201EF|nr:hypothetical protein [Streptomyces coffeae]